MPTLEEIKSQISNIDGGSKFFGFKEIKELPNILWEDEVVECLVQGVYGNGMGILCSTNKRLVFVDKGMLYGLKVEDFPYDKITSIQYETGMLMGKITIFASGNKADIDHIDKKQARDFGEYVRARVTASAESAAPQASAAPAVHINQKLDALERLSKLKEAGVLTDEELQAEKAKIMA